MEKGELVQSRGENQTIFIMGTSERSKASSEALTAHTNHIALFYSPSKHKRCVHYIGHYKVIPSSAVHFNGRQEKIYKGHNVSMSIELEFHHYSEKVASIIRNGD